MITCKLLSREQGICVPTWSVQSNKSCPPFALVSLANDDQLLIRQKITNAYKRRKLFRLLDHLDKAVATGCSPHTYVSIASSYTQPRGFRSFLARGHGYMPPEAVLDTLLLGEFSHSNVAVPARRHPNAESEGPGSSPSSSITTFPQKHTNRGALSSSSQAWSQ